jgi:uncharacterized protein (DUF488 family)
MPSPRKLLLTVGHSNHSAEHFRSLLSDFRVEVLVDVRSWPHSRFVEWADRSSLPDVAEQAGAKYLFLGEQLGGRPQGSEFYDEDGFVLYWKVATSEPFRRGIERLGSGIERCRIAVMCSEENPAQCHRRLLVSKVMLEQGIAVTHIRGDGHSEEEPGPIHFPEGSLLEDEEKLWRSSRSVSRKRAPRTSLAA